VPYKRRVANLSQIYHRGRRTFPKGSRLLRRFARTRLRNWAPYYRRKKDHFVITDDNMSPEYKHRFRVWRLRPSRSWAAFWQKLMKKR